MTPLEWPPVSELTIVDDFPREAAAIEVDTSLPAARVIGVLERLEQEPGLPRRILVHNGPGFAGKALDAWEYSKGIELQFIQPGKPVENAYIERFNGRFRDECLSEHWFTAWETLAGLSDDGGATTTKCGRRARWAIKRLLSSGDLSEAWASAPAALRPRHSLRSRRGKRADYHTGSHFDWPSVGENVNLVRADLPVAPSLSHRHIHRNSHTINLHFSL